MKNNIKVSVIIPIYKVEKYIEKCIRSLFKQTLDNIEYIFIDDCGNDNSLDIIQKVSEEYYERKPNIKIIKHHKNLGSFAARISGTNIADGEYIIHCDGDDWADINMYESMYKLEKKEDADIVWCDFIEEYNKKYIYCKEESLNSTESLIKRILEARNHGALWNKLVKKELYISSNINIIEGINIWEDLFFSINLLLNAKNIIYINKAFYHYNKQNTSSLLSCFSIKKIYDKIKICNSIKDIFIKYSVLDKYSNSLKQRQLWAKMEFITDRKFRDFDKWRELYPDAKSEIFHSSFSFFNKIIFYFVSQKNDIMAIFLLQLKESILKLTHKN